MKKIFVCVAFLSIAVVAKAQQDSATKSAPNKPFIQNPPLQLPNFGEIHGNFQFDAQYYRVDSLINAPKVPEKILSNGFLNLTYTKDKFYAGLRYESFLNPLQGYPSGFKGSGVPHRYAGYIADDFEVTVGNFYEQFGSGTIFRAYEEKNLGIDNSLDGLRVRFRPVKGIYLKGFVARQRSFFALGPGIVRGADIDFSVNEIFTKLENSNLRYTFGGGFISKYQPDNDPIYILPENVGAFAGRAGIQYKKVTLSGEYAYKINDPSADNKFIYKEGTAISINAGYATKGLGISVAAKRIDNMSFRSDRAASRTDLTLSFLPAATKQHTYMLPSFYPYATQPNGELGIQGEITYTFKKGSLVGGRYGTTITANYASVWGLDTTQVADQKVGYTAKFLSPGKLYFEDKNIEITKKITSKLKAGYTFMHLVYNKDVVQGVPGFGIVYAYINVLDVSYKLAKNNTVRTELQHMRTKQDMGSWAAGLIEYTIAPKYFIAVLDQFNYGNSESKKQIHYVVAQAGYLKNTLRIAGGYGKQREGIICVGGVCRNVPASNGFTLSITSSF